MLVQTKETISGSDMGVQSPYVQEVDGVCTVFYKVDIRSNEYLCI